MESDPNAKPLLRLRERFFKSWLPPVAVVGGIVTLVAAALKVRPARPAASPAGVPPATPETTGAASAPDLLQINRRAAPSSPPVAFERQYVVAATLRRGSGAGAFSQTLLAIALDSGDRVVALGDGEVRIFDAALTLLSRWRAPEGAECLTVGRDGRVYVAGSGRVEILSASGTRLGGFRVTGAGDPPMLSAIKVVGTSILVADASARLVRRFDESGRQLGVIGDQGPTRTFMLPNGKLDIDVDPAGVVRATDTGRHSVTSWSLEGKPLGRFGKFGMSDPADFVGCCNPVNLATSPDGTVVTGEKMVARVKVFSPDGRLLGVIGPEHFDPMCTQIHLAVDSRGRILTADPVRCQIQVFEVKAGASAGSAPRDARPAATGVPQ